MSSHEIDPFIKTVGKFLGVPPEKIRFRQSKVPGGFTLVGPRPKPTKQIPDVPHIHVENYCFTFVLNIEPPRAICDAYQTEYDALVAQLPALIAAAAWDEVAVVAERLSELATLISSTCRPRDRAITYCIFPEEWFEDPGSRPKPH